MKNKNIFLSILVIFVTVFMACEKTPLIPDEPKQPEEPTEELCHCIMDTLKGEWSWIKKSGGFVGGTWNNEFASIVKILSQNENESINYEVFVADTLFYTGSFQIQEGPWSYKTFNIKLPHVIMPPLIYERDYWFFLLGNEKEICFWDGIIDGYFYQYKKIEEK